MRILIFIITLFLFNQNDSIAQTAKIKQDTSFKYDLIIKDFCKNNDLKNASIGFFAFDLTNNKIVGEYNADVSLVPASVQKIFTTAAALEILGKDYVFKTYLETDGEIDTNKILLGNLYIKGCGDPTLGSEYFVKKNDTLFIDWIKKIKELGIDSIAGDIIVDDRKFSDIMIPSTWIWGDIGNYFGAFPSSNTVFDNMYYIYFYPSDSVGADAKIEKIVPDIPDLQIKNNLKISSVNKDLAYIFGGPQENTRYIKGTIPKTKESYKIKGSIPNPSIVTANYFYSLLATNNVKIKGIYKTISEEDSVIINRKKIDSIVSPKLKDIVYNTNLVSNNLSAEHLLLELASKKVKNLDYESATNYLTEFWKLKGINTDGMYLNDGSGLSRYNSITARQLGELLILMKMKSSNSKIFFESLPIAGKSGTLKSLGNNTVIEGKVRAKSGYLTRARNYAGYLKTYQDNDVVFVIMMNNYNCTAEKSKKIIEELLVKIYSVNLN